MDNIFGDRTVLGETSILKDRWAQDGCAIVTYSGAGKTEETLYTVTAGKTLYIKSLQVQDASATALSNVALREINAGGTLKWLWKNQLATDHIVVYFDPPITFSTSVYLDNTALKLWNVTFTGWEE